LLFKCIFLTKQDTLHHKLLIIKRNNNRRTYCDREALELFSSGYFNRPLSVAFHQCAMFTYSCIEVLYILKNWQHPYMDASNKSKDLSFVIQAYFPRQCLHLPLAENCDARRYRTNIRVFESSKIYSSGNWQRTSCCVYITIPENSINRNIYL
jgi:hypothetical protein